MTRRKAPARTCELCELPTDGYVCSECYARYVADLGRVRWLVQELETALTRQTRYGNPLESAKPAGSAAPLPLDPRATKARVDYRRALVEAVRQLSPNRDHWPAVFVDPAGNDNRVSVAAARWLSVRGESIRFMPEGAELVKVLDRRYKAALHVINRPADRWYAGPCLFGDPPCPADLYAELGSPTVTCPTCGEHFDVQARRDYLLREVEDQNVNAITIARAVSWLGAEPLKVDRVYQWAARNRLVAKATDRCETHRLEVSPPKCRACQPRYRVGDALDLLAADVRKSDRETSA